MTKHLIVVSGPGERLQVDLAQGVVRAEVAPGEGLTHVRVELTPGAAPPPEPTPTPVGAVPPEPPRPWDITMSFMGGPPVGVSPGELETAIEVHGTLSPADLFDHLARTPTDGRTILRLSAAPDG